MRDYPIESVSSNQISVQKTFHLAPAKEGSEEIAVHSSCDLCSRCHIGMWLGSIKPCFSCGKERPYVQGGV